MATWILAALGIYFAPLLLACILSALSAALKRNLFPCREIADYAWCPCRHAYREDMGGLNVLAFYWLGAPQMTHTQKAISSSLRQHHVLDLGSGDTRSTLLYTHALLQEKVSSITFSDTSVLPAKATQTLTHQKHALAYHRAAHPIASSQTLTQALQGDQYTMLSMVNALHHLSKHERRMLVMVARQQNTPFFVVEPLPQSALLCLAAPMVFFPIYLCNSIYKPGVQYSTSVQIRALLSAPVVAWLMTLDQCIGSTRRVSPTSFAITCADTDMSFVFDSNALMYYGVALPVR